MPLEARKTGFPTIVSNSKPRGLIEIVVAVLQKCPDLLKDRCCSCTETCPTCSDDINHAYNLRTSHMQKRRRRIPCK